MDWTALFAANGKTNLAHLKKLFQALKLNFAQTKIIAVVGTNGKGSVANFLAQALVTQGKKVGLFTSPHIFKPNERIKVNHDWITDAEVTKILAQHPFLKKLHFFEMMLLIALIFFEAQHCEIIILEAGIGGRYDSTNIVQAQIGVLTSLGLDHQELLGSRLSDIAWNKAGIINPGMHFYLPLSEPLALRQIFMAEVAQNDRSQLTLVDNRASTYALRNKKLAQNILATSFQLKLPLKFFKDLTGRTEMIKHKGYAYIYDVAHNYAGIKASLNLLRAQHLQPANVVLCLARRKAKANIIELFKPAKVYVYQLNASFYTAEELGVNPLPDPLNFKPQSTTLFIGSFQFVSELCPKN